ncbi:hypothetical protein BDY17DRAFT_129826 [Neohortaea acidophila]|uniref:Thioester reductase (TE) domain-containing protein n=1 Tax=Neohortaea acidophila TaxID=245834 RepID=A0A6A6PWE7_9PEZI|nr:uncharacterized protein BDY17DRAFT_129826 [Neohortaea acidophila]KAF2484498.1 hypothetical protein BDY17DRAFT_129826 [Neohortaea acidophila]
MKILLTGATGFIGTEILEQSIKHNYIQHIYCLTRTELDPKYSTHPKVTQILHDDFSQYPDYLLDKLASYGVEGCIWTLGRRYDKYADKSEAEKVEIHYRIQAANAFANALATKLDPNAPPMKQKFPFRFVFISGWGAEQNQFRTLWMYSDSRKTKGAAEKGIFDVADNSELLQGKRCFEAIALRVGAAIPGGDAISTLVSELVAPYIAVDRLGKCAIRIVMQGTGIEGKRTLENKECLGDDWAMVNSLAF